MSMRHGERAGGCPVVLACGVPHGWRVAAVAPHPGCTAHVRGHRRMQGRHAAGATQPSGEVTRCRPPVTTPDNSATATCTV